MNNSHLKADNNRLKTKAVKKPLTVNPLMNQSANNIMTAFITKRNKPNVTTVTGSVKKTKTGRTNIFNTEIVNATKIAEV